MTPLLPSDERDVEDMISWAAANRCPLEIRGGGSKLNLGLPRRPETALDLSGLAGVIDYAPSELVITAKAGTPLGTIEALLAAEGQALAFDPPDFRSLLNGEGAPTIAGTIACNISGPRRVRAGAARDHFLGFKAVNGRGEAWKAGGRVVKNVTGYDLCKLQCGAMGTLSALTEVSVRTVPLPETTRTALIFGLSDEAAVRTMARALNMPLEIAAAAHLPADVALRSSLALNEPATALRLEGHEPSVAYRAAALKESVGVDAFIDGVDADRLWSEIGSVFPLAGERPREVVWRVQPTPARAADCLRSIRAERPAAVGFYDWGGGLLWVTLPAAETGDDGGASVVRGALQPRGGHASLIAAPASMREAAPAFHPEPPAASALSARIKSGFDPLLILNPGRMHGDR